MGKELFLKLIKIGIFATLLTPFIMAKDYYFPYVGPKSLYFMAIVEVVFFLWMILAWQWKQYRPDLKNPVIAAILVFLSVSFISSLAGVSFSASFWSKFERMSGLLMLSHLAAFTVVAWSVLKKQDWVKLFTASTVVAAVVGIYAIFDFNPSAGGGGLIGNDSFWGAYTLFNIFIALYLILSQKEKLKIFSAIIFIVLVLCLFLEGSPLLPDSAASLSKSGSLLEIINSGARAAKIAFLAGMALLGILRLATLKNKLVKIVTVIFACSLVCAAALALFIATRPGNSTYQTVINNLGEGTVRGRLIVWQIAWKGFLDRPYLGWGPENFDLAFVRYYNPCLGTPECSGELWYDRAHNIIFDTLVTTGIFGFISYLFIFISAFYVLWRFYFANKIEFASVGVFTALFAAYFLQDLTVFDMVVSYIMFFLCLGFIASLNGSSLKEDNYQPPLKTRYLALIIIIGVIYFIYFILNPLSADRNVIIAASMPYGSEARVRSYRVALESSPMGRYQIRLFFAQNWLAATRDKNISNLAKSQIEQEFAFHAQELEKSRLELPLDCKSRLILGQLYNSWSALDPSKIDLAQKVLEEAIAISPQNQQGYWNLAQTRLYQFRIGDAVALAQKAYDLYPNSVQAQSILGEVRAVQQKNTDPH